MQPRPQSRPENADEDVKGRRWRNLFLIVLGDLHGFVLPEIAVKLHATGVAAIQPFQHAAAEFTFLSHIARGADEESYGFHGGVGESVKGGRQRPPAFSLVGPNDASQFLGDCKQASQHVSATDDSHPPINRLLSLDGGGIRGIFTLEILARIEQQLRERYAKPDLVLADYFNFIGGTSTGAIIAGFLAKGAPVEEIQTQYLEMAPRIFKPVKGWTRKLRYKFDSVPLMEELKRFFQEPGSEEPMLLGSNTLRTFLMLVVRNGSTGSAWPLTNNPNATYNREKAEMPSNLDLPLWQLIRASAAAPTFFPSEMIKVPKRTGGNVEFEFIDGGVSPYLNPALAMYLHATLPEYGMNMTRGAEQMLLVSVGTGAVPPLHQPGQFSNINRIGGALRTLTQVMSSVRVQQDTLCRVLGKCLVGNSLDREIGSLVESPTATMEPKHFTYMRYDHDFTEEEQADYRRRTESRAPFPLDGLKGIPILQEIGARVAEEQVEIDHYPNAPLHGERCLF